MSVAQGAALGRQFALAPLRRRGAVAIRAVAVFAVTAAIMTTVTGENSARLPSPVRITHAGTSHSPAMPSPEFADYTRIPLAPLTGCRVLLSNPSPPQGSTAETASVLAVPYTEIRLEADYAHTRSVHAAQGGTEGTAVFGLPISHAAPGVAVDVMAMASRGRAHEICWSSFIPMAWDDPTAPMGTETAGRHRTPAAPETSAVLTSFPINSGTEGSPGTPGTPAGTSGTSGTSSPGAGRKPCPPKSQPKPKPCASKGKRKGARKGGRSCSAITQSLWWPGAGSGFGLLAGPWPSARSKTTGGECGNPIGHPVTVAGTGGGPVSPGRGAGASEMGTGEKNGGVVGQVQSGNTEGTLVPLTPSTRPVSSVDSVVNGATTGADPGTTGFPSGDSSAISGGAGPAWSMGTPSETPSPAVVFGHLPNVDPAPVVSTPANQSPMGQLGLTPGADHPTNDSGNPGAPLVHPTNTSTNAQAVLVEAYSAGPTAAGNAASVPSTTSGRLRNVGQALTNTSSNLISTPDSDPIPLQGPITTGPITAGPISAGPVTRGPVTAGPISAGPITSGPITTGPITAGPITAGPIGSDPSGNRSDDGSADSGAASANAKVH